MISSSHVAMMISTMTANDELIRARRPLASLANHCQTRWPLLTLEVNGCGVELCARRWSQASSFSKVSKSLRTVGLDDLVGFLPREDEAHGRASIHLDAESQTAPPAPRASAPVQARWPYGPCGSGVQPGASTEQAAMMISNQNAATCRTARAGVDDAVVGRVDDYDRRSASCR